MAPTAYAIGRKLSDAPIVFTHGEDERFARAVLSIINRLDFDQDAFRNWVASSRPAALTSAHPSTQQLRGAQNLKNLLAKLEVLLSLGPPLSQSAETAREAVRAGLKDPF